jgi:hypothetical protein
VDLRERIIKDLKGGSGFLGALKGTIYSSRNEVTLSDMKDTLASAIQIFQVCALFWYRFPCKGRPFQIQEQMSIENILIGVIQDAKNIIQALKDAGEYNDLAS